MCRGRKISSAASYLSSSVCRENRPNHGKSIVFTFLCEGLYQPLFSTWFDRIDFTPKTNIFLIILWVPHCFSRYFFMFLLFRISNKTFNHESIIFQDQILDARSFSLLILRRKLHFFQNMSGHFFKRFFMKKSSYFDMFKPELVTLSERTDGLAYFLINIILTVLKFYRESGLIFVIIFCNWWIINIQTSWGSYWRAELNLRRRRSSSKLYLLCFWLLFFWFKTFA